MNLGPFNGFVIDGGASLPSLTSSPDPAMGTSRRRGPDPAMGTSRRRGPDPDRGTSTLKGAS